MPCHKTRRFLRTELCSTTLLVAQVETMLLNISSKTSTRGLIPLHFHPTLMQL
ncbi:hypothetical protein PF005_g8311 [Phytophthora fragariae]|uniref:Uncharacterized protein n=2 Tax=Phytophthora TaxID=4783 RepID=A0A6A3F4V2_9STRA|nr:hypothetical protein PF003_g37340 [Phytophthora fragariae]KAE9005375.1 hypothetical protein PR002_g16777 [Phytophthora rubi]KAE8941024.1 hypothetical protein PF009_g9174 [Phytophthora fragariae]KAE9009084.1 hypothetical protein PR001_g16535 [Phytophthora rubi]KAE9016141.1 hypothetical protein PF011_g7289 [Phytophthora fragariae]